MVGFCDEAVSARIQKDLFTEDLNTEDLNTERSVLVQLQNFLFEVGPG